MNRQPLQWSVFMVEPTPDGGGERVDQPPVLVMSRESANEALPMVTVLPLAGLKKGRRIYPNEASLPSETTDLDSPSVLMAHQIRTIPKSWLSTRIGSIEDPGIRSAVRNAVRVQLDLEPGTEDQTVVAKQQEVGI